MAVEGQPSGKPKAQPKPAPKPTGHTVGGRPAAPPGGARVDAVKPKPKPKPKPKAPTRSGDEVRQSVVSNPPLYTGGPLNIKAILDYGMSLQGIPYVWGGTDPSKGLDCSGLVMAMYAKFGVKLPRVSSQQAQAGTGVSAKDARPGDLVAFDWDSKRPGIDHIGIYLGNGKMLVAPRTGDVVKVQSVDIKKAAAIRRVVPDEAYTTLRQSNGSYLYVAGQKAPAAGSAGPSNSGPAAGGGDPGNSGGPPPAPGQPSAPVTARSMLSGETPLSGFGSGPNGQMTPDDFGFAASFFNSHPDLKKLLEDALTGGGTGRPWTPEKFAVEFQKTGWYRTHAPAAREWIALLHNDPAGARRKVEITAADIRRMALESGAEITSLEAQDLATKFLSEGWSPQELKTRVGAHVEFKKDEPWRGQAGVNYTNLKQRAAAFGVPMTEAQLARWVQDFATEAKTEQDFENWVKEQAKILYPALGLQIDRGVTPEDVAQLYIRQMSDVLEEDPARIDWTKDPLIQKAMSFKDPNSKEASAMPLWAFEQELKRDPRWLKTNNAANAFMGVAGQVLKDWGLKF